MSTRTPALGFATGFLLVLSAGVIVTGYTPERADLWILLPYLAGAISTLIGVAVWRWD